MSDLWRRCLERLEGELSAEDLHTWLMPLQARDSTTGLQLFAPNPYTLDTVRDRYLPRIEAVMQAIREQIASVSPYAASGRRTTRAVSCGTNVRA